MCTPPSQGGPFPVPYAFVVQLAANTSLEGERLRGRVEHIVSHEATIFDSPEGLLDFVTHVLEQVRNNEMSWQRPRPGEEA